MQVKATIRNLILSLFPLAIKAQTTYLFQDSKEGILLERMEVKAQRDSVLNFSKIHPYSRKQVVPRIAALDNLLQSPSDRYLYASALMASPEWTSVAHARYRSRKPTWKHFYKTPANLVEVDQPDFFLVINPAFQYTVAKEQNNTQYLFQNSRGAHIRGRIANRIGFAGYVGENQERDPLYVQSWVAERKALPGQGYYQAFKKTAYDYFDARGYISFNATKYIDVSFGYDRNSIGNGLRSLYLSDFPNNALFLRLNTRIWKFNYQNLFMELQHADPLDPRQRDYLLGKKYAAMHHLDMALTPWLNVGLFESVVFGRTNKFDFSYLNPIIFMRSMEQQNGSGDNSMAGIDFKANAARRFQFYGQLLFDEFKLSEVRDNKGWWANKWGWQLGAKYIDVLGVPNLDLQVEVNRVRPFTYSHDDSVANYTHYNQPLAHPLGANFQEVLMQLRYQPKPRWTVLAKGMYYFQGRDSAKVSSGSNIFLPNVPPYRKQDYGYSVGNGVRTDVTLASLLLSYELKQNLYLEACALFRNEKAAGRQSQHTTVLSAGIRWNMWRRSFLF
ncbi:Capsule assembly protein Wzi [Cnuella takakiae]|uniref:Capsule assembly protein Wzi n=1 Tax=Cnuella takakiae TaxID=1302690 RepID=A0A1M4WKP8_9BACT|nr:hypothetical protein [Cnuella takakiae]OLY91691.1 hypothetical protein BUE76_07110 [Cnuella takakiae]SHE81767.1 Capsule assembly protein Wzi [Cnuella takakiae]